MLNQSFLFIARYLTHCRQETLIGVLSFCQTDWRWEMRISVICFSNVKDRKGKSALFSFHARQQFIFCACPKMCGNWGSIRFAVYRRQCVNFNLIKLISSEYTIDLIWLESLKSSLSETKSYMKKYTFDLFFYVKSLFSRYR